jgi:hypothetical protein
VLSRHQQRQEVVDMRMSLVSAPLVQKVSRYDAVRLRQVAASVIELGLAGVQIDDPRLDAALATCAAQQFGDTPERLALRELVAELDTIAWDAQDAAHAGEGDPAAYGIAFARARVANAVELALDGDPLIAALESAYEVQAGLDNLAAVEAALHGVGLSGQPAASARPPGRPPGGTPA